MINHLKKQNWNLLFHRLRMESAEIDLILQKRDRIILVEVKKLNDPWRSFQRINNRQLLRLKKSLILFSSHYKDAEFSLYVAWVLNRSVKMVSLD